ncbi:MAG: ABC transporter ATP-binding protein [Thermomicrobiales bacterium]
MAIELVDVTRRFRVGRRVITALDSVSLDIARGEFVSVIGASGSGKSTLLNIVSGIDSPDDGIVRVLGEDLSSKSEDRLSAWRGMNVGIVFQFFQLMPTLTVKENVVLPMDLAGNTDHKWVRAEDLLERVGIADLADNLPSELSGGEQQRAAIARALANEPALLIADEPTGNLDSENGRLVIGIIERLWRNGTTVLMVTHDREIAARAPRRILMKDGRVIEDASTSVADSETVESMVASDAP